jgi:MFS transporter, PPP family, 3-phenylpropionic acid transporter
MTATTARTPGGFPPELRAAAFYFTIYMTAGVATAYAGIWFADKGITPREIGILNALPVFLMLVITLFVGRVADRASDWRQVIVIGAVAAGLAPVGLFFVDGFWGILLFWTLGGLPIMAVTPVLDAATMRMTRRRGTDFGAIRAVGTIGYTAIIFITGYATAWFGGGLFLWLLVGVGLLRALVALALPRFRAPRDEVENEASRPAAVGALKLIEVMKPWFLLPLVGWAMIFGTHLLLNAFQALVWKEQGIGEDVIGLLIVVGALSEAAMFFGFARFSKRFTARFLILVSALVSVARWIAMGFSPGVEILFGLQLLHGITFALGFIGCVSFIANWTSEDIAAEAQSFFQMLQQAMSVIVIIGFGLLLGTMGARGFFASAAFAAVGAVLIWLSLRMQQPKAAED